MRVRKNIQETAKLWEREYKKGFTGYMVLLLLHEAPLYGYEIKSKLELVTGSRVQFETSAIYHLLKALNGKGYVESYNDASPLGPNRKYYRITDAGRKLALLFTDNCLLPLDEALHKTLANIQ
jgi:PadR family transcriptional regulator, regulatory protein PadR